MNKKILIAAAVLGVILRVVPIWARQTWYDENFTIILARLPLADLFAATAGDVHPPLWYLICWTLARLDLPGWAICRLPAVIASLASLYVFWRILRFFPPRTATIAFVLFALLPAQIYFAQEGRQYALLSLLVLMGFLFAMTRRYVGLFIVTTVMLYLHNYGMFYAAALALVCLVDAPHLWKRWMLAMASAGLLFIPWLLLLFRQMAEIQGSYWMVNFTFGSVLSDIAHSFWSKSTSLPAVIINFAVFWCALGAAVIYNYKFIRVQTNMGVLLAIELIMVLVPPLLAVLVSLIWQPVMLFRALVPISPFLVLFIAFPLACISHRRRNILLVAFFVLPALITNLVSTSLRFLWSDTDIEAPVIAYIAEHYQPGDVIYHNSDGFFVALEAWRSFPEDATIARVPECDPVLGGLSPVTRQHIGELEAPLPPGARTWTFALASPLGPQCELDTLEAYGLLDQPAVMCSRDDQLVSACLYLTP